MSDFFYHEAEVSEGSEDEDVREDIQRSKKRKKNLRDSSDDSSEEEEEDGLFLFQFLMIFVRSFNLCFYLFQIQIVSKKK